MADFTREDLAGSRFDRVDLTGAPHMHLYVIYPVVVTFGVLFLSIGLRNFRRRVLS